MAIGDQFANVSPPHMFWISIPQSFNRQSLNCQSLSHGTCNCCHNKIDTHTYVGDQILKHILSKFQALFYS